MESITNPTRRIWHWSSRLALVVLILFLILLAMVWPSIWLLPVNQERAPAQVTIEFAANDAPAEQQSIVPQPSSSNQSMTQTLASLTLIDAYPLYRMTYYGDYDLGIDAPQALESSSATPWACSLFVTFANPDNPLFARNFDWENNPALLLFTDPSDGYASVSMVDISYLGYDRAHLKNLETLEGRAALMRAPRIPFDGMNEYGLAVGMAAVDGSKLPNNPDKPSVGSLRIIRLMLDRAKTTDEAVALFDQYTIDFSGGPQIHYLIADRGGESAVVELKDGKVQIVRNVQAWQAATNFYLAGSSSSLRKSDTRYNKLLTELDKTQGLLEVKSAMNLLKSVAQPHTRWSILYGLRTGELQLSMAKQYNNVYRFVLPVR